MHAIYHIINLFFFRFLTVEDVHTSERLVLFVDLFFVKDGGQHLQCLLNLVHGAINLHENFESSTSSMQLDRRNITVNVVRSKADTDLPSTELQLSVPSTITTQVWDAWSPLS